jgi:hypothetical protein
VGSSVSGWFGWGKKEPAVEEVLVAEESKEEEEVPAEPVASEAVEEGVVDGLPAAAEEVTPSHPHGDE